MGSRPDLRPRSNHFSIPPLLPPRCELPSHPPGKVQESAGLCFYLVLDSPFLIQQPLVPSCQPSSLHFPLVPLSEWNPQALQYPQSPLCSYVLLSVWPHLLTPAMGPLCCSSNTPGSLLLGASVWATSAARNALLGSLPQPFNESILITLFKIASHPSPTPGPIPLSFLCFVFLQHTSKYIF